MRTIYSTIVLPMVLVLAPSVALAQGSAKRAPLPLTKVELRACMLTEDALKARDESLRGARAEFSESSISLSEEAKALAEVLRSLVDTDEAAVAAYNAKNAARNALVDIHNKRAEAMNSANAQLQSDQADYLATCVSRPFLLSDRSAILKELGRPPDKGGLRLAPPTTKSRGPGVST